MPGKEPSIDKNRLPIWSGGFLLKQNATIRQSDAYM